MTKHFKLIEHRNRIINEFEGSEKRPEHVIIKVHCLFSYNDVLNKIIKTYPFVAVSRMTSSTSVPLHLSSGVSPVLFLRRTSAP